MTILRENCIVHNRACKSAVDVLCFRNYSELVGLISEYVEIDSSCFALGSRINFSPLSFVQGMYGKSGKAPEW